MANLLAIYCDHRFNFTIIAHDEPRKMTRNQCEHATTNMITSCSHTLERKIPLRIVAPIYAIALYFALIVVSQTVKPDAVHFGIDKTEKLILEPLCGSSIRPTLKYRVLNPVPILCAMLGDPTKPPSPSRRLGADIIRHYDHQ